MFDLLCQTFSSLSSGSGSATDACRVGPGERVALSVPYLAGVGLQPSWRRSPARLHRDLSVPYLAGVGLQRDRIVHWLFNVQLSVPYLAGVGLQHSLRTVFGTGDAAFSSLSSGSGSATGLYDGKRQRPINFQFPI